jgi:hypothetical protein
MHFKMTRYIVVLMAISSNNNAFFQVTAQNDLRQHNLASQQWLLAKNMHKSCSVLVVLLEHQTLRASRFSTIILS